MLEMVQGKSARPTAAQSLTIHSRRIRSPSQLQSPRFADRKIAEDTQRNYLSSMSSKSRIVGYDSHSSYQAVVLHRVPIAVVVSSYSPSTPL